MHNLHVVSCTCISTCSNMNVPNYNKYINELQICNAIVTLLSVRESNFEFAVGEYLLASLFNC